MPFTNRFDSATLVEIYRRMFLIKHNDDMVHAAAKAGRLNLIYYSPRGQEVIPSALSVHLNDEDYICTIYRGVHDQLAKGLPARLIWAEYAGRATGSCKGKGGPMHITYPEGGVMVTTGVVGSSMPIAVGLGLSSQVNGNQRVTVANFGDGASNIGAFHESMNLAAVWKLPVIFMCQNNRFAEHSRFEKFTGGGSVSKRAEGYGMVGVTVDGNDPEAVWNAARDAVARARAGEGPTLIEANTFRFQGHLLGDPGDYIPADEMAAARANDPVDKVRQKLLDEGHIDEAALQTLEDAVRQEIREAEEFALSSPWPELDELSTDVFDTVSEPLSSIPVSA
ncbi:pyruvate dehydrogenase E1 component alpha subunit [Sphingobium faniae]|nr:pyruvate dehydrogenase E1 component alpha subunit [Sphingobium faniae]